jgi:hypothetical protein
MKPHSAMIVVEMNQALQWKYPIKVRLPLDSKEANSNPSKGITEIHPKQNQFVYLEAKSRDTVTQDIILPLPYFVAMRDLGDSVGDQVSLSITSQDIEQDMLEKALSFQKAKLYRKDSSIGLSCQVIFGPEVREASFLTLPLSGCVLSVTAVLGNSVTSSLTRRNVKLLDSPHQTSVHAPNSR